MTYSGNKATAYMENTLSMYWRLSKEARALDCREDSEEIADIKDEAEVLADMCEWPKLRAAIKGNIAFRPPISLAKQSPA